MHTYIHICVYITHGIALLHPVRSASVYRDSISENNFAIGLLLEIPLRGF